MRGYFLIKEMPNFIIYTWPLNSLYNLYLFTQHNKLGTYHYNNKYGRNNSTILFPSPRY